jgi:GTP:adenosylcobinamide-phosphate guanylyltransferase
MAEDGATWTAIILAGQRPGVDPLAAHFGQKYKALIPVAGAQMLSRVAKTLLACPEIARIVVLGQEPDQLRPALPDDPRIDVLASVDGISRSIIAVAGTCAAPWPLLITTADHPMLSTQIVGSFLGQAGACDVSVGMVERSIVLALFPETKRTWLKFWDGAWSGANLFALTGENARAALTLWTEAEGDRKQAFKLFHHFGWWLALRAITRTIGLDVALRQAGKRLGMAVQLVALADGDAAVDVDTLADHKLADARLARRG